MEPNTQTNATNGASTTLNKNKKLYTIIILIIIAIIAIILIRSKVIAPVDTEEVKLSPEDQKLNSEINSATTFDNEADLQAIDKEF